MDSAHRTGIWQRRLLNHPLGHSNRTEITNHSIEQHARPYRHNSGIKKFSRMSAVRRRASVLILRSAEWLVHEAWGLSVLIPNDRHLGCCLELRTCRPAGHNEVWYGNVCGSMGAVLTSRDGITRGSLSNADTCLGSQWRRPHDGFQTPVGDQAATGAGLMRTTEQGSSHEVLIARNTEPHRAI